jgi:hypothetical protein
MSHKAQNALLKLRKVSRVNFAISLMAGLSVVVVGYSIIASQAAVVRTSLKSGNWSDASVWGGTIPQAGDPVIIAAGHNVTFDQVSFQSGGVTVAAGGTLTFDPTKSTTLLSNANVIVNGKLVMRPNNANFIQTLRFTGVNESNYIGGGMDPLATDVGLWVMGDGQLDLVGQQKSGWLRLTGSINSGATTGTLESAPVGWQPGDEIVITPTEAPTVGDASWNGFDNKTLSAVNGSTLTWNSVVSRAHPKVNNQWAAEVGNLTRNVRIEGTGNGSADPSANGRAHIFIRSTKPQTINYVGIRHMGPRKTSNCDDNPTCLTLGRYGLHIHMSGDGSRGSTVYGTVIRDNGGPSFVPHNSNGITFRDTIAYNVWDEAYWWDLNSGPGTTDGGDTFDVLYDHAMAALVKFDPAYRGYRLNGFTLAGGPRNTVRDSVAVGIQGNTDSSGFDWPESSGSAPEGGIWNFFKGNVSHNNKEDGIFVWQNNDEPHVVSDFVAYHNSGYGIDHGAYINDYRYTNGHLFGNANSQFSMKALSHSSNALVFDNFIFDGGGISDFAVHVEDHNIAGDPVIIRNSTMKNTKIGAVDVQPNEFNERPLVDLNFNNFQTATDIRLGSGLPAETRIRVQPNAISAYQVTPSGRTNIATYASQNVADYLRPQLDIASPDNGYNVSGVVPITPLIFDDKGVTKVELYVNNALKATSTTTPFTINWDTSGLANGSKHTFYIKGFDASGKTNVSRWVTVFIGSSTTPPPTPTPPPPTTGKQGDLNGDNQVNILDLSILLTKWGQTNAGPADINGDGSVNVLDMSILLSRWGT